MDHPDDPSGDDVSIMVGSSSLLTDFANTLGSQIFGAMWPQEPWAATHSRTIGKFGTPRAAVNSVRSDVEGALSVGSMKAVLIALAKVSKIQPSTKVTIESAPLTLDDKSESTLLQPEDYSLSHSVWPKDTYNTPTWEVFEIKRSAWLSISLTFDWKSSWMEAPFSEVQWRPQPTRGRFPRNSAADRQKVEPVDNICGRVFVLNPRDAMRGFFHFVDMPDERFLQRYRIHRSSVNQELVTAAFRYLSITRPSGQHGAIKNIEDAMAAYWACQLEIDPTLERLPGRSTIQALASKVFDQWDRGEKTASALINSVRPSKPNKVKPRK